MALQRITLLLALGTTLSAATPDPAEKPKAKTEAGATVTVTAEATQVEVVKTPNPVKILVLEQLEQIAPRDLGQALEYLMPGQLISYGGPGTAAQLFLGGAKAQHTVVMVDGIRVADPSGFGMDFSAFGTAGIDRVEVLRGASSTLYGADAHGGVVSVASAPVSRQGFSGSASLAGGNQGQGRIAVQPSYGWKSGWLRTELDLAQEQPATAVEESYRRSSGHIGLGQYLGESGLITVNYRNSYQGVPLPYQWDFMTGARSYLADSQFNSRMECVQAGYRHTLTEGLLLEVNTGQTNSERYYSLWDSHYYGRSRQALASLAWSRPEWTFTFLSDGTQEEAWSTNPGNKDVGRHLALALESAWEPMEALRLVGSLRQQWDRVGRTVAEKTTDEAATDATVWKLGVNTRLPGGFRIYASAGTAYNTPSLVSQRWNADRSRPALDVEKSHTLSAGADWESRGHFVKLEAQRTSYSNLVGFLGGMASGYYANLGDARIQSTELSGGHRSRDWSLEAYAQFQEGRDLSKPEDQQLAAYAARPFSTFGLRGHAVHGAWKATAQLSRIGHRYQVFDDSGTWTPEPNKTHFTDGSVSLAYTASRSLELVLRGEHLFQDPFSRQAWEQKADLGRNEIGAFPGYPAQTRTVSLEARYRF